MRAVAIASDRSLQVVDIDRPVPGAGEVLLDVSFCGICGSDLHMLQMPAEMIPAGHVLGHEFTGVIAALGASVGQWDVGERVAVVPMVPCAACYACRTGRPNLCENGIDQPEHIAAGRIPCGQVATTKAPLEHAPRWFADLSSGATQQVKVLLSPRPGGPSSAAA